MYSGVLAAFSCFHQRMTDRHSKLFLKDRKHIRMYVLTWLCSSVGETYTKERDNTSPNWSQPRLHLSQSRGYDIKLGPQTWNQQVSKWSAAANCIVPRAKFGPYCIAPKCHWGHAHCNLAFSLLNNTDNVKVESRHSLSNTLSSTLLRRALQGIGR